jgi:periplasmic protein CpxP/Spy
VNTCTRFLSVLALLLGAGLAPAVQAQSPGTAPRGRPALERQFRQQVERQLRERVGLDESQVRRLREVSARLEPRRAALMREERAARVELRRRLATDTADQGRIAALLDDLQRVHRARLDLVAAEQKELAAFMTPLQRARYLALQEQIRRRMDEMRRGGGAGRPRR